MRTLDDDSQAVSGVLAFLVASVVFLGSVGAILIVSQDATAPGSASPADAAVLSLQAQGLADLLVTSPGYAQGANGVLVNWQDGATADALVRLGLRSSGNDSMDFVKFQNLRRAGYAPITDGLVNYPEARASLGLTESGLDFHVRAFPSLKSVRDILASGTRDPNLRVAYIGDVEAVSSNGGDPTAGLLVGTTTCVAAGNSYTVSTPITNGGSSSTQVTGFFDIELGIGDAYEDRTRSYVVAPGAQATLSVTVPYKAGRTCASGEVDLEIWDPNVKLWETPNNAPIVLSGGSAATTPVGNDLWLNPGRTAYAAGQDVTLDFDGDLPTKTSDPSVVLSLTVKRLDGTVVHGPQNINVDKNVRSVTVDKLKFSSANEFVAELTYPLGVTVGDPILVLNTVAAPSPYAPSSGTVTYQPTAPVPIESAFLSQLIDKFCPYYFDSSASYPAVKTPVTPAPGADRCNFDRKANPQHGDVFTDERRVLNNDLPLRLINATGTGYVQQCNGNIVGRPNYEWTNVLVVGSNVDHNSMTSGAAKYAVCEWVMGGGTMIVFGSADQQVNWLQPIFHAAITSSSSPVSTPDASHPILNRADALSYDAYNSQGQAWAFNGQTAADQGVLLNNVVTAGASDSVLTISNPGAFGDGTIILTTWLPYDLFGTGFANSQGEGLKVVNNFLMQGYRDLFLDYGPQIPRDQPDGTAWRVVEIWHPEFADPITLTVHVYVF